MITEFIKGFIVGFGASIPLGPLGVMCIQKTLSKGRNSGLMTGFGAALSDTIFATISLFGLAYLSTLLNEYKNLVMIIGGVVVAIIGLKIFITNPVRQIRRPKSSKRLFGDMLSAIAMTITNPGAILLILGMFTLVGIDIENYQRDNFVALILWGVFIGASAWWFILTTSINLFRNKFRLKQLVMINRVSGIIIIALGLISLAEGLWKLVIPYINIRIL